MALQIAPDCLPMRQPNIHYDIQFIGTIKTTW